ncbi:MULTISPECIES: DUF4123 domain-containing protein [Pectobacterium]|uniref:DUF4123 domain-containing protein n=1 Tax=Pectobacterium versatile TaxID=2488639 RepID=A0A855MIH7_9GAMM|nr:MULTISPECIES: DUF4123 domain-containing protein [Pectobacterium]ASN84413.1 Hypothetical protein SCC1_0951 [Pectobacterium versatile]AZK63952.1 DUF4123 domain-containing protein [Pectobacterium versatile]MBQ4765407.1 DUF4123 domain-containing protein [Pectobacterium versatile]MCA5932727.1 DUF4123 domain-containing protein [Pectobacterium versatile]MCA5950022.1 DUF4123 domain-containing protein [Pectobacterium versatile]
MLPESIWHQGACIVLLEGAYLTTEQRERLSERPFLPLYFHDDLFELINLGPWLWLCPHEEERLLATLVQQGHVVGLLESSQPLSALQKQLALGVRVIEPEGQFSQLLRFYTPHALPLLVEQHDAPWFGGLFGGIERWWLRECDGSWRELSLSIPPDDPVPVKLTPELYRALQGSPDEHRVLALWQGGERCGHFPPCERMSMVRKALRKAEQAGAVDGQRRLWALAYLEGGRQALEEQKGRT